MTSIATAMPNSTELVHRLHRVAKLVVTLVDAASDYDPPDQDATGRAMVAVALWSMFTGINSDDARAISYARRVAHPDWPRLTLRDF